MTASSRHLDAVAADSVVRAGWTTDAAVGWALSGFASPRLWRWVGAVLVAFSTADAVLFVRVHRDVLPQVAFPLAVLSIAPLLLLRWRPVAALGFVMVANGVFVVCSQLPWSPVSVLGWLVALVASPLVLPRQRSLVMLAVCEVAVVVGACVPSSLNARPWDAPITEALAALLAWGAAETVRSRREADVLRAVIALEVRDLHAREMLAKGRANIARELHDVVAHHVSLIAVRAAMAPYQVDELSPAARDAFSEIAAQARSALDELRTVLGVLRTTDGAVSQAPQPGLADLTALIDGSRASGMTIDLEIRGAPGSIPESVQLCCYRVVQEALTNAARHAPGAPIRVRLSYGSPIEVMVTNAVAVAPPRGAAGRLGSDGFGLLGMHERVTSVGGALFAGRDGTVFQVRAQLPNALAALDRA